MDVSSIVLYTQANNSNAIKCYEKLGFRHTEQRFYSTDLMFGSKKEIEEIQKPFSEGMMTKEVSELPELNEFKCIFGKP